MKQYASHKKMARFALSNYMTTSIHVYCGKLTEQNNDNVVKNRVSVDNANENIIL